MSRVWSLKVLSLLATCVWFAGGSAIVEWKLRQDETVPDDLPAIEAGVVGLDEQRNITKIGSNMRAKINVKSTEGSDVAYILLEFVRDEGLHRFTTTSPMPFLVAVPEGADEPEPKNEGGNFDGFSDESNLEQDEFGFWAQKYVNYLVLDVGANGSAWDVFVFNMGEDDLSGSLRVSFHSAETKPCARGEDGTSPCSGSGDCNENGECICNNTKCGGDESCTAIGRVCEELSYDLPDLEGRVSLEVSFENLNPDRSVHFRYVVDCSTYDTCFELFGPESSDDLKWMMKIENAGCKREPLTSKTNEFYLDDTCHSTGISVSNLETGYVVYLTSYNAGNSTQSVSEEQVTACGAGDLPPCSTSAVASNLVIVLSIALSIMIPSLSVAWLRLQGPRPTANNKQRLTKREINKMFPATKYSRPEATQDESAHEGENEEDQCNVCLCEYEDGELVRRLPCDHLYHAKCLDKWILSNATCPECRGAARVETRPNGFVRWITCSRGQEGEHREGGSEEDQPENPGVPNSSGATEIQQP